MKSRVRRPISGLLSNKNEDTQKLTRYDSQAAISHLAQCVLKMHAGPRSASCSVICASSTESLLPAANPIASSLVKQTSLGFKSRIIHCKLSTCALKQRHGCLPASRTDIQTMPFEKDGIADKFKLRNSANSHLQAFTTSASLQMAVPCSIMYHLSQFRLRQFTLLAASEATDFACRAVTRL